MPPASTANFRRYSGFRANRLQWHAYFHDPAGCLNLANLPEVLWPVSQRDPGRLFVWYGRDHQASEAPRMPAAWPSVAIASFTDLDVNCERYAETRSDSSLVSLPRAVVARVSACCLSVGLCFATPSLSFPNLPARSPA